MCFLSIAILLLVFKYCGVDLKDELIFIREHNRIVIDILIETLKILGKRIVWVVLKLYSKLLRS